LVLGELRKYRRSELMVGAGLCERSFQEPSVVTLVLDHALVEQ
jgi:hypothetical protein